MIQKEQSLAQTLAQISNKGAPQEVLTFISSLGEDDVMALSKSVPIGLCRKDIYIASFERLLEKGLPPNSRSSSKMSLLNSAIDGDAYGIALLLLKCGADPYELLNTDATLLMMASYCSPSMNQKGMAAVCLRLIEMGVDVNARDTNGETALHYACSVSNAEAANVLLLHGANPSLKSNDNKTALEVCSDKTPALLAVFEHRELKEISGEINKKTERRRL